MKALSLLQPWATLIMLGYKEYETRSWATQHRGTLAIAASAGKPAWAREVCETDPIIRGILAQHGLTFDTLPRGSVLGVVQLTGMKRIVSVQHANCPDEVAPSQLKPVEVAAGDYTPGRWAWALSHVHAFATPVPCKGALSLWQVPPEVEEQFPLSSSPIPPLPQ
ncbi:ASCH domain-containing protein [Hymenobacter cheonanensis]|uniref:ASCH domain-containing protein n=1 Tax=Hymenobacter sp. CA2-7 TaxID=3063993 RepID=UPI0027123157|nr:ASCH domain-containing protein [Hymenobacter sp. CA2-7]MDO7887963.1 ASCH domain-containing protein [Hymenobacter sp. CA2-7]